MCIATREIMDSMFDAYRESTLEPDDIPQTHEPVWILGKRYNAIQGILARHLPFFYNYSMWMPIVLCLDLSTIRQDITSKIWCTYRKSFVPIGGVDGLTTDKGWGCMLRCGQMVLAQALVNVHLGRNWIWETDTKDPVYLKILRRFEDRRQAPYSIHQIAQMGASEGKDVGQWFGPNTVAQVLK